MNPPDASEAERRISAALSAVAGRKSIAKDWHDTSGRSWVIRLALQMSLHRANDIPSFQLILPGVREFMSQA